MRQYLFTALLALSLVGCDSSVFEEISKTPEAAKAELQEGFNELLNTVSLEEVDYRQLEEYQGLYYKVGSNEPFVGVIKNQPISVFGAQIATCRIEVSGGLPNGLSTCFNAQRFKISETQLLDGQKNGLERRWDPKTQHLVKEYHWVYDQQEGLQKEFDPETGKPVEEYTLVNGKKTGPGKLWIVNLEKQRILAKTNFLNGRLKDADYLDEQSRLIGSAVFVNEKAISMVKQTWDDNNNLIAIKREASEDPNYQGGYPAPELVLDGSQFECKEIHYCYTSEWQLGKPISGTFSFKVDEEVRVSYKGLPDSDGQLVKDGVEHFTTTSKTGATEQVRVVWNKGFPESIQVTSENETKTVKSYPGLKPEFFERNGSYGEVTPEQQAGLENDLDKAIRLFMENKGYEASDEYQPARKIVNADFNQNGIQDTAVLITVESENMGNQSMQYLVYLQGSESGFTNADSLVVEPSTEMTLQEGNSLLLTSLSHGPDDPRCCPTQQSSKQYLIHNNRLFAGSDR